MFALRIFVRIIEDRPIKIIEELSINTTHVHSTRKISWNTYSQIEAFLPSLQNERRNRGHELSIESIEYAFSQMIRRTIVTNRSLV